MMRILTNSELVSIIMPNRFDIVIKYNYFSSLLSNTHNKECADLYRRHIMARTRGKEPGSTKLNIADHILACDALLDSMQRTGFNKDCPIKINPDLVLLGGAHRLACGLVLQIPLWASTITDKKKSRPWGLDWFRQKGFSATEVEQLQSGMQHILEGLQ